MHFLRISFVKCFVRQVLIHLRERTVPHGSIARSCRRSCSARQVPLAFNIDCWEKSFVAVAIVLAAALA